MIKKLINSLEKYDLLESLKLLKELVPEWVEFSKKG